MLTGDDWFGHRGLDFEPVGDKTEWTRWDFVLADKMQTIADYTDQNGVLLWWRENPRMEINAVSKINKFDEAVSTKGGKDYKPKPGEYYIPDFNLLGGEWPTLSEFLAGFPEDEYEDDIE